MAKLQWDLDGQRKFEQGVSKGVLFPWDPTLNNGAGGYGKGVVWNGLTNVTQSPTGGEAEKVYADNTIYLTLRSVEELEGSIEAYTYPDEFCACDGSAAVVPGFSLKQQTRQKFALCYRSEQGNDSNPEAGYKLHIIYGATCSPSERAYETINDSPEAISFSWDFTCVPVPTTIDDVEYKPVASVELDSILLGDKINLVEAKLYGTDAEGQSEGTDPELLLPAAIYDLID